MQAQAASASSSEDTAGTGQLPTPIASSSSSGPSSAARPASLDTKDSHSNSVGKASLPSSGGPPLGDGNANNNSNSTTAFMAQLPQQPQPHFARLEQINPAFPPATLSLPQPQPAAGSSASTGSVSIVDAPGSMRPPAPVGPTPLGGSYTGVTTTNTASASASASTASHGPTLTTYSQPPTSVSDMPVSGPYPSVSHPVNSAQHHTQSQPQPHGQPLPMPMPMPVRPTPGTYQPHVLDSML